MELTSEQLPEYYKILKHSDFELKNVLAGGQNFKKLDLQTEHLLNSKSECFDIL